MAQIKTKLRTKERAQETWRLKAAQLLPLKGDGVMARAYLSPRKGGHDSYLGRNKWGHWDSIAIEVIREGLVEARYRDWLAERDNVRGEIAA